MKAVIMAGGEGTRLRPLTCNLPKPLAALCGKPVVEHILDLLELHGCSEATFTLMYQGEKIQKHFENYKYKNISLNFSYENTPLGTAGCVLEAAKDYTDDFIVISGDAMCNFDLKDALEYHKKSNADATIIVKQVSDPREYGLVNISDGKVVGFTEKPSYAGCVTNLANTGVYILSPQVLKLIPEGKMSDFASDIFPEMLSGNMKIFGYEEQGYWCDIGDFKSYMQCQRDILSGKIRTVWTGGSVILSRVANDVKLSEPVYIGENVKIGAGTVISAGTVIGDNVTIGEDCRLFSPVILTGAYLSDKVNANSCIICDNAKLMAGSGAFEDAVVGEGAVIGENSVINPGIRIWQNKQIQANSNINYDVKYGSYKPIECGEEGITGETNVIITPQVAAVLGSAVSAISNGAVAVSCSADNASVALKYAFMGGVMSAGGNVSDCRGADLPVLIHLSRIITADVFVYISANSNAYVSIFTKGGLPLTRKQERKLEGCINRGEFAKASWNEFGKTSIIAGYEEIYKSMLKGLNNISGKSDVKSNYRLNLRCPLSKLHDMAAEAFNEVSDKNGIVMTVTLTRSGKRAAINTRETGKVSHEKLLMLAFLMMLEEGYDISVPYSFPSAIDRLAQKYGRTAHRFFSCPADESDKKARETAVSQPFLFDGTVLVLTVINYLSMKKLTLSKALSKLPEFTSENRYVEIDCAPPKLLRTLCKESKENTGFNEGVILNNERSRVLIRPEKSGHGLLVFAESYSQETAGSLCDDVEKMIKNLEII